MYHWMKLDQQRMEWKTPIKSRISQSDVLFILGYTRNFLIAHDHLSSPC